VITNETTDTIEDLIKQRIRDKVFDDVERKKKTQNGDEAQAYKKEILLEHEKSKMSLAQVYEQEYMKKQTVNLNLSIEFYLFCFFLE
jgi:U3 small nucleolar RNA-associated protein MPP10